MVKTGTRRERLTLIYMLIVLLSGCTNFGPGKVVQDRFNYTAALSDSWKNQMLLNLVKIRYGDTPIFLDISSVITSYELSGSADLSGNFTFQPENERGANLGMRGFYANRPTISYTPLSGEKFSRSLMQPIPTTAIIDLIQSGYPADLVLRVLVQSINGVQSRYTGKMTQTSADFYELADKFHRIQESGGIAVKIQRRGEEDVLLLVFMPSKDAEDIENDFVDVKRLLGLAPQEHEFRIVYGLLQANNKEIAILSRSVLQVLTHLAASIEVPAVHVAEKRVSPTHVEAIQSGIAVTPLIRIQSSQTRPADSFLAVQYRNYWYSIDDRDMQSKQIFSFLMFVFTLVDTGSKERAPVVTVPVR